MVELKTVWFKFRIIKNDIRNMKKVSQLIDYIPNHLIEKVALILLLIWISSPLFIMFRNIWLDYNDSFALYYNHRIVAITWFTILQQVGYISILLFILSSVKSILSARRNNIGFKGYILENLFAFFLFLMLIWTFFSTLFSNNVSLSIKGDSYRYDGLLSYFAYFGVSCCGYIIRCKQLVLMVIKYFRTVAVSLSVLLLINLNSLNNLFGLTNNMAVFQNSNHFAYYLCIALMCSVLLFLIEKKQVSRLLFRIAEFITLTVVLIQNRSFGPYLAVIVGFMSCFALILWLDKTEIKRIAIIFLVFLSVSIFMNASLGYLTNDFKRLTGDLGNIVSNSEEAARAGSGRWILWTNAIKFVEEKPLFGYGPDNLGARYAEEGISIDRPHNEFLQFAACLGIPALIYYLSALIVLFKDFYNKIKQVTLTEIGLICAIVAYLTSSMFGNTMYYTTPFFAMILGVTAGQLKAIPMNNKKIFPIK